MTAKPTNNMKAKAGFLMLLIALVSFTGFGSTTADLNQDSTADIVQVDQGTSVNVVFELSENVEDSVFKVESGNKYLSAALVAAGQTDAKYANRFEALFEEADAAFQKAYRSDLDDLKPNLELLEQLNQRTTLPDLPNLNGDVGWSSAEIYRNPRDGITYAAFFLFHN